MNNAQKFAILARLQGLRAQNPSLFWTAIGGAGVALFGMVAAVAVIPGSDAVPVRQVSIVQSLDLQPEVEHLSEDAAFFREDQIQRGDTLSTVLARLSVSDDEAHALLRDSPAARDALLRLQPGQVVHATTTPFGRLLSLELPGSGSDRVLRVERRDDGLQISETPLQYTVRTRASSGVIRSSLFAATDDAGLPDSVAVGLAEIFSNEIDFHRDLRRGDRFRVVYEVMQHRGMPVKTGRILAAEFINDGQRHTAIWYPSGEGRGDYYAANGQSLKRGFLRSPLEFSRVTSGMGMRFHPVHQRWRAHTGVDYGAPTGTRVRTTADGVVAFAGVKGGYGNMVIVRHTGNIETAYAHLSRISVRTGQRVSQNDTVGLVGATGTATGPHLHYEFRVAGVHKDPLRVVLPEAPPLSGAALIAFRARSAGLMERLATADAALVARID